MTHIRPFLLVLLLSTAGCSGDPAVSSPGSAAPSAAGPGAGRDAAGGARRITVGNAPVKIGDATSYAKTESETTVTKTRGPKGGLLLTKKRERSAKWKEECIALDVGRCNALRIRYDEDAEGITEESVVVDLDGKPTKDPERKQAPKKPHVVQGNTYRVTLGGAEANVERERSSKVDDDEVKALRKRFSRKGRDQDLAFSASIPAEVAIGQSLEATAAVIKGQLATKLPDAKIDSTCTVQAIRDEGGRSVVVLDLKSTVSGDSPKGALSLTLTGRVEIWADTREERESTTEVETKVNGTDMEVTIRSEERVERARIASFGDTVAAGAK